MVDSANLPVQQITISGKYEIFVDVFLSWDCEYDSAIAVFLSYALKSQVYIWHEAVNMTVGSHNFVKLTVIKLNCQKHNGCIVASGKKRTIKTRSF